MNTQSFLNELQKRIDNCKECYFVNSFNNESIPEHRLSSHWSWWFKNKFPCEKELYYTFFKYNGRSNIVLITLRPSTEWGVADTAGFMLANALKACGLVEEVLELIGDTFVFYEGILVTDLVKCRGSAKEARKMKTLPRACINFLREEFNMVRECSGEEPKIMVMGKPRSTPTRDLLWKYRKELGIHLRSRRDIPCISFHSYRVRFRPRYKQYKEYCQEIYEALKRLEGSWSLSSYSKVER
ncbi:MAG: hypothetical protein DRN04_15545 [Thermoprotei archaeon]|nr:MAG: hypothetical protein DRN04_15545 [Thermoprotei archaeon]